MDDEVFRAELDKLRAEEDAELKKHAPMLGSMWAAAQNQRLAIGHKARERTLHSIQTARVLQNQSQAAE